MLSGYPGYLSGLPLLVGNKNLANAIDLDKVDNK